MVMGDRGQQAAQKPIEPQHLDIIEFSLAEFDITDQSDRYKQDAKSHEQRQRDLMTVNMRKWPRNRIVNYEFLERFKKTSFRFYNQYMEMLLLYKIGIVNKFTAHLELDKIFANCNSGSRGSLDPQLLVTKKRLIVDVKILNTLQRKLELNWFRFANSLYPIKTIGDGNCLVKYLIFHKPLK